MNTRTTVTPEIMTKAWKLHERSVDNKLISEALGISQASATRIVRLMTMAKNGEDIDSIDGTNHKKQKAFAKKFFGIPDKCDEESIEDQTEQQGETDLTEDNFKEFAVRVLFELSHLNKLLEGLCKELGVKGVCNE